MYQLLAITSWLWNRVTGDDDGGDDESTGTAYSTLDASVHYAHGDPRGDGVRALKRANAKADELEAVRDEER